MLLQSILQRLRISWARVRSEVTKTYICGDARRI